MILDLITFIFIVILSLVLCMNDNNYKCQLSHIILGLSVIVFYKLAKHFKLNQSIKSLNKNEGFADPITSSINDFISGNISDSVVSTDDAKKLSDKDLAAYNDKLTQLINTLNDIKNQQSSTQLSANVAGSLDTIQKLDLEAQQQYQMFQIDYLNKQIQNAKDIINAQTVAKSSTNYKPIKVYSSCIISNANGTTSVDVPVTGNTQQHTPYYNPATQQMLNTISQNSTGSTRGTGTSSGVSPFLNLSQSTGIFGDILNNLAKGNVNINL
jgi:hypothetical protein